jgi:hypothetical protein
MPRTDEMLKQAGRKRDLAGEIRKLAQTFERDALRDRVIRQAEKLEAEATSLETIARAVSH